MLILIFIKLILSKLRFNLDLLRGDYMARPRREINAECGKRLKTLLEETGTTQNKLADLIHISQQTISQIITGKANLTPETARMIIEEFPDYRLNWLLEYDDLKTVNDQIMRGITQNQSYEALTEELIVAHGYSVSEYLNPKIQKDESGREYRINMIKITSPSGNTRFFTPGDYLNLLCNINNILEGLLMLEFKIPVLENTVPEYYKDGRWATRIK